VPALDILSEITAGLAGDTDPDSLLQRFLGTILKLADASAGAVRVATADGQSLRLVAAVGLPAGLERREQLMDADCGVCGAALRDNSVTWSADLKPCAQRTSYDYFGESCTRVVAVPMHCKGRVLGVFNLFLEAERELAPEVSLLLRMIGELLGLALENARLTRENLRVSLMNERQTMANEVHDSIAQTLHYMKMRLALLQETVRRHDEMRSVKYLDDVNLALGTAYSSLRELLTNFRNRMDPHGLLHALQDTVDGFHDKTGVALEFANHAPELDLPPEQEVQVFHIVQEALANVGKHAHACHARLVLDKIGGRYLIAIEDDGDGLMPGATERATGVDDADRSVHFGINIMRERAQRLGGQIAIETLAGGGTRVRLEFPAPEKQRTAP
jgi:two-component system nitrate/nitrite sensor histidine kinase NarX